MSQCLTVYSIHTHRAINCIYIKKIQDERARKEHVGLREVKTTNSWGLLLVLCKNKHTCKYTCTCLCVDFAKSPSAICSIVYFVTITSLQKL